VRGEQDVTLTLERRDAMPLILNRALGLSPYPRRVELADWREWAWAECDGLPALAWPVSVTVTHLRKNRASMPDVGAPILAVKAILDGVVDAGLLPDDGPDYVRRLLFLAPEIVGFQGLRVEIREGWR
jgi:hypothetical protein